MGCAYSQDATSPCSTPDLKTTKFNESDKSTPETTNVSDIFRYLIVFIQYSYVVHVCITYIITWLNTDL